jgi:alkylation response protein AidB-like acyl-CoA dehydrogenase
MDVRFSAEQSALRQSVVQVVDRLAPKSMVDLGDRDRATRLDAAVAASGWRDLRAGGDGGRPLASAVEVAIVAEELARGAADTPFLGPSLAAELCRAADAEPASGAPALTVALSSDLSEPAESPADGVAIDAAGAAMALVLAPSAGGWSLAHSPVIHGPEPLTGTAGVDLTRPSRALGALGADGALGPDGALGADVSAVAAGQLSVDGLTRWTAFGTTATCADLVGTMRGALALSVEYARQRRQFGQPIGSFQAVQHLLADAAVAAEGSANAMLHAAWSVDARPSDEALASAAAAKAYCARAASLVCETAIQVHGGFGNTWECMAHVYLRRALLSTAVLGGIGTSLSRVLSFQGIGTSGGLR